MELNILLRLILAHLLGDFMLQKKSWVDDKDKRKGKSFYLYLHVTVVALLTYIALWDWKNWYVPLIVFVTHLAIDYWKSTATNTFTNFIIDQALHIAVLVGVWMLFYLDMPEITGWMKLKLGGTHFWILTIAYYFVIGPLGIAIGKATGKWQKAAGMDKDGLDKAGMWIGRSERVLVLTFIIAGQFTALGFLMTAKSILRFPDIADKAESTQKKTEYVLVGTLISFVSAAITGLIASYLLSHTK
jgi:hypothetical protein